MNEVKTGKLQILAASCTCNFISKLLKEDKNLMIFGSTVQKVHWLFCVGSLESEIIPSSYVCHRFCLEDRVLWLLFTMVSHTQSAL